MTIPRPISILTCADCGAKNRIAPAERGAPHCGTCGKPLPWVVDASESTFEVETKAAPTVVVDLWAPWCGPCRFVSPILEELARDHAGRLKIVKVNVDENPGLSRRFDAMSIPTMLVLRGGKLEDRIVGAMPKPDLWARIAPFVKTA
jgi:thioredoxin 2